MPNRDLHPEDPRGEARWRETDAREDPRRSFGEKGRYSSDQARYYGADTRSFSAAPSGRPHPERPAWRRGRFEAGRDPGVELPFDEQDALTRGYYSLDGPHGGQEYGIEPHGYRERLVRRRAAPPQRETSEEDRAPYGDQPLDARDPGVRQFGPPADYAYHPGADIEFEPDYLAWREEQLRSHDRDYAIWRTRQLGKYDAEYRAFRGQRQDHFDRSFSDWRSQQDAQDPLTAPEAEGQSPPEDRI